MHHGPTTTSKNEIYRNREEMDLGNPSINSNNNSGGNRNRRKRSQRQAFSLLGFFSSEPQRKNSDESIQDRICTILSWLSSREVVEEQERRPTSSTSDYPSDVESMGSGLSGPKRRVMQPIQPTRASTNLSDEALVGELDTDGLNMPSMPATNERIKTNNSKADTVSVGSGKVTSECVKSAGAAAHSQASNLSPSKHQQMLNSPRRQDNDICESPSLCTCRPYSARSKISPTNPPSYEIYGYLHSIFSSEGREVDYIQGDGNCFFRALSKQIYSSEDCHFELRQTILELMKGHRSEFEQFTDAQDFSSHIHEMRKFAVWATTAEIYGAATLLQRDIYVFSPDHTGTQYRWLLFSPRFPHDGALDSPCEQCYITLCHTNGNHYDRVISLGASCNCTIVAPQLAGGSFTIDLVCDKNTSNNADVPPVHSAVEEGRTRPTLQAEE